MVSQNNSLEYHQSCHQGCSQSALLQIQQNHMPTNLYWVCNSIIATQLPNHTSAGTLHNYWYCFFVDLLRIQERCYSPILAQFSGFHSLSNPPLQPLTNIGIMGEFSVARELMLLPCEWAPSTAYVDVGKGEKESERGRGRGGGREIGREGREREKYTLVQMIETCTATNF